MKNSDLKKVLESETDLTPEGVVAKATPPESALHQYFEWDNEKAGHKYRVDQARTLIRRVVFEVSSREVPLVRTNAFRRDTGKDPDQQGYDSFLRIKSDSERRLETVISEKKACLGVMQRLRNFLIAIGEIEESKKIERSMLIIESVATSMLEEVG